MKKSIILFVVLFVLSLGLFTMGELNKIEFNAAIEKSPGYAVVTAEGMTKKTKRGSSTFQVNYVYQVAGTLYKFDTDFMDEAKAQTLAATPGVQVAFPTTTPEHAVLKTEFEQRLHDTSVLGAVQRSLFFALFIALIATAVLVYRISWFRN